MKTVRLLLLLVAGTIVFSVAMILRRESERTPESVLSQARALVALEEPNFNGALLTIEQGLQSLGDDYDRLDLAPLVLERMRIYRARWDGSLKSNKIAHELSDLRQVLEQANEYLGNYDSGNSKAIFLGTQAALEMGLLEEAAKFAQALLESSPISEERARGERSLGTIDLAQAERKLTELVNAWSSHAPGDLQQRLGHARRVALLQASYPSEETALNHLKSSLPAELETLASSSIQAAARFLSSAKGHFQRALELFPDEPAVVGLQKMALQARAFNDVIDIGLMALSRESFSASTGILSLTLKAMRATGRSKEALNLLRQRMRTNKTNPLDYSLLDNAELMDLCQLLLELGDLRVLDLASKELRIRPVDLKSPVDYVRQGYFYTLLSRVSKNSMINISAVIKKARPVVEAYEGQLMEYWTAAAASSMLRERRSEAVRYLTKAARSAPLDPSSERMRLVAGSMWQQYAEASLGIANTDTTEAAFAHAMRFPSGGREALKASYQEAGEQQMNALGRSTKEIRLNPTSRDEEGQYPQMGPWEACFRARRCLELSQAGEVALILGPTLTAFPGLPDALLLLARSQLAKDAPLQGIEYLLEIEERGLASPTSRSLFNQVPAQHFGGEQLRRMLQATPGDSALLALLQRCRRLGKPQRLLAMLKRKRPSELPAEALLLGVETQLDQKNVLAAHQLFEHLAPEARSNPSAKGSSLRLVAALLSSRKYKARGQKLMRQTLKDTHWNSVGLEPGIDSLLALGHIDLAREALELADSGGTPLSPSLLLRWAWSGALAGHASLDSEALEALSRAEPYLASGQADFTRLLMALDGGQAEASARWAGQLLNSVFASEPIQRALLLALSGDLAQATQVIQRFAADKEGGKRIDGRTSLAIKTIQAAGLMHADLETLPGWRTGSDSAWYATDLRASMVMLLAAQSPPFAAWVLARARSLDEEKRSSPFYGVLSACAWRSLGNLDLADAALKPHTLSADSQPEAWQMREDLALAALDSTALGHSSASQTQLMQLRQKRLKALGPQGDSAALVTLIRARELSGAGRTLEAATYIKKIRQIWPDDPELLLAAARLARQAGALPQAFGLYIELFDKHGQDAGGVLPEILSLLEAKAATGELTPEAHRARIQSFQARLPQDPSLPLLLAKMQLTNHARSSAWNAMRALAGLARFQKSTAPKSLEDLLPGCTQSWVEFIVRLDQGAALELAQAELNAHPERVELWRLWLNTMLAGGDLERALGIHESILSIFNDEGLERSYGLLLLNSGQRLPDTLRRSLVQVAKQDPEVGLCISLNVLAGRGKPASRDQARLNSLEHWQQRESEGLDSSQTARLLLRGLGAEDQALPAILRAARQETSAPHLRDLFSLLLQLQAFPAQPQQANG